jgi:hypothetical protein
MAISAPRQIQPALRKPPPANPSDSFIFIKLFHISETMPDASSTFPPSDGAQFAFSAHPGWPAYLWVRDWNRA